MECPSAERDVDCQAAGALRFGELFGASSARPIGGRACNGQHGTVFDAGDAGEPSQKWQDKHSTWRTAFQEQETLVLRIVATQVDGKVDYAAQVRDGAHPFLYNEPLVCRRLEISWRMQG